MGALTAEVPKPMLLVSGKPLLEHVLERLQTAGVQSVFLVTGYRAETIEHYFADYPMRLVFQRQEAINGTARATLLAREFVGEDGFLLTYGDILVSAQDYQGIGAQLEANPTVADVLGVKRVEDPWQGAAVYEQQGRVTKIIEKPARGTSSTNWNMKSPARSRVKLVRVFESRCTTSRAPGATWGARKISPEPRILSPVALKRAKQAAWPRWLSRPSAVPDRATPIQRFSSDPGAGREPGHNRNIRPPFRGTGNRSHTTHR